MSNEMPFMIDPVTIKQLIDQAVEKNIQQALEVLTQDPAWLTKIENLVNQTTVQRTLDKLNQLDLKNLINQRVDENFSQANQQARGIQVNAQRCELTVLDDHVVVEHNFTARSADIVEDLTVKNLAVRGSINTDNTSWDELKNHVARRTLDLINEQWREQLVQQVQEKIQQHGIDFDSVEIGGEKLVHGGCLANTVTDSNLQSVGVLRSLEVAGETQLANTVNINNKRVGINTANPEMALSVWDEEVSVIAGKIKSDTAYIGTGRVQNLTLGVNRNAAITVDTNNLTTVKKLRVGLHQLGHGDSVPGYNGTKGDIVFNSNPELSNNVLGWVCLGGTRWKVLRTAE